MQDDLARSAVKNGAVKRYTSVKTIWDEKDRWHIHTRTAINSFIAEYGQSLRPQRASQILNVGSAGEDYGFFPENQTHTDIVDTFIKHTPRHIVADAEALPFCNCTFDAIICVGSVLNYCSALEVIAEFQRVITPGGLLILEFETSSSLEFIATGVYDQDVSIVNTFYQGQPERIWVYSSRYIRRLLKGAGFHVRRRRCIHILSPLGLRLGADPASASCWARTDRLASYIPWVARHGCNVILACQKGEPSRP
jgi:hypothetical protein